MKMRVSKVDVRIAVRELSEKFWIAIAWRLPKSLVKWCGLRIGAHATGSEHGTTLVADLTFMDAMKRWE